jgi:CHAT domain-containing protein
LLGPLTSAIEGKTHLIVIPDASAFLIPFEALVISKGPDTGKYVIEHYSLTYHMSLGHLVRNDEPSTDHIKKARTVLLVGNPTFPTPFPSAGPQERAELVPLAGAQREIERIREVVGPTNLSVYVGDEARKDRFQERLGQTTIAHFATHGVLNERFPWASYLALAGENGNLLLDELPRTPLVADLVVLSACETGRGRILAGEGVWGFQSQFLSAGAKNVVGTLWRVEDESTAEFMEEFYRGMGPELTGYAHALRASKLKLLHSDKWHHPVYWAPFLLYGEAPTAR